MTNPTSHGGGGAAPDLLNRLPQSVRCAVAVSDLRENLVTEEPRMSWLMKSTRTNARPALVTVAVLALFVGLAPSRVLARTPAATKPASLTAFEARVEQARRTLPTLIESAQATAARTRE